MARTLEDCAKVLDALKDPENGYYDPRDPYTTVPRSSVLDAATPRTRRIGRAGALKGMRIGIVRESMAGPPGLEERRADRRGGRARRSRPCSATGSARPWSSPADPLWTPRSATSNK